MGKGWVTNKGEGEGLGGSSKAWERTGKGVEGAV